MSGETTFHYPLPDTDVPSRWAGLSQPTRDALVKAAVGPSVAEQLIRQSRANTASSPEVSDWAEQELNNALDGWRKYSDELELIAVPESAEQLAEGHPNYAETISRLFEAREALFNSGETNPEGINLGETMHLALVPWQDLQSARGHFKSWVKRLRDKQGIATSDDYIGPNPMGVIVNNQPLYRNLEKSTTLLEPSRYLEDKIASDGLWGIMLAQTSAQAGVRSMVGSSPSTLTDNGQSHLSVAGHNVDAMGIFEWISLTLQEDPSALSSNDWSWLLANYVTINGDPQVACGYWNVGQVESGFDPPGYVYGVGRPRLAVM